MLGSGLCPVMHPSLYVIHDDGNEARALLDLRSSRSAFIHDKQPVTTNLVVPSYACRLRLSLLWLTRLPDFLRCPSDIIHLEGKVAKAYDDWVRSPAMAPSLVW